MVVGLPPMLDQDACFLHGRKLLAAQALIAELAIEALNEAILPRAARFDVGCAHVYRVEETANPTCDELWPVITPNKCWDTTDSEQVDQHINEVVAS